MGGHGEEKEGGSPTPDKAGSSQSTTPKAKGLPRHKCMCREGLPGSTLRRGNSGNNAPPFLKGPDLLGLYDKEYFPSL
jgi:hypothetical protein